MTLPADRRSAASDRGALVGAAAASIRRGSKSFYMASQIFDRPTRERAWLLYSWCRRCDDLSDGQELGSAALSDAPADTLQRIRAGTEAALAGSPPNEMAFRALAAVAAETGLPHRFVRDHVEGFALDLTGWRPANEADLIRYCYHVAGAVGCMMAVVMGVSPDDEETLGRASDLGIAFQLSNIARDLADDAAAGRCYLPADWLDEAGMSAAEVADPARRGELARLAARLVLLAQRYEASARIGARALPFRSRWAVLAAAGIYGAIGRKVVARGASAWDSRTVVPMSEKLAEAGRALREALGRRD